MHWSSLFCLFSEVEDQLAQKKQTPITQCVNLFVSQSRTIGTVQGAPLLSMRDNYPYMFPICSAEI